MVRIKRGNSARKKRKKVLKRTKGFKISNSRLFKVAHEQFLKSLSYSYVGRKQKKRYFRKVWIVRVNAAVREEGTNYSTFLSKLKQYKIGLNRKMLSDLSSLKYKLVSDLLPAYI